MYSNFSTPARLKVVSKVCAGLFLAILMAACTRNTSKVRFKSPEFTTGDFRISHSVLVASGGVEVLSFKKSFATIFMGPDSFSTFLTQQILDSLHKQPAISIRPAPGHNLSQLLAADIDSLNPTDRGHIDSILVELGARYLVNIHHMTVTNTRNEKCIVNLTVELRKVPGLTLAYEFTVEGASQADRSTAQTALMNAVNGAAQEAASQLRGY